MTKEEIMTTARALNPAGLVVGLGFGATTFGIQGAQILLALWVFVFTALIWVMSDSQRIDRWLAARRRVSMAEYYQYKDTFTPQSRKEVRQLTFFWATGTWGMMLSSFLWELLMTRIFQGEIPTYAQILALGIFLVCLAAYAYCALLVHSMLFEGGYQKYVDEQARRDRETQLKQGGDQ